LQESIRSTISQNLVIYDGNCELCQRLADWASKKTSDNLKFVDSKSIKPEQYELSQKDFEKYVWLIKSDLEKSKGAFAIGELLKQMEYRWMILGSIILLPPFSFIARGIYWLVAKNRRYFRSNSS
jgi:predicted DCC family thiol-disulfide oxidoreductase YuxK